jgi:hypothetical protein
VSPASGPQTLTARCLCGLQSTLPVASFRVIDQGSLLLLWDCGGCAFGHAWVQGRGDVAVLRTSGAAWTGEALALAARVLHPAGR